MTTPVATIEVKLFSGLWVDDVCHRVVWLRPLSGYDEAYLLTLRGEMSLARWTSEVLARCVLQIGSVTEIEVSDMQALTAGDREALLLHLRRLSFGETMLCTLQCTHCGEKLHIDVPVDQLLLSPAETPAYWYRANLPGTEDTVTFRLPTGADQEAVASLATANSADAVSQLLTACVHEISREREPIEWTPEDITPMLAHLISERDPQAEIMLNSVCPECETRFEVLLDMGAYFADEINHYLPYLYREVHLMAWHYHWSEAGILQMTRPHRKIYLDLLDETLREMNS